MTNRIAEIHEGSKPGQWSHAPSRKNPADVCSRRTSAADLKIHAIWWSGPGFLSSGQKEWPSQNDTPVLDFYDPEVKKPQETVLVTQVDRDRPVSFASSAMRNRRPEVTEHVDPCPPQNYTPLSYTH